MSRILPFLTFLLVSCLPLTAQVSHNLDSLLALESTLPPAPEKVRLLRDIGFNYSKTNLEKALDYYKRAIALGTRINETKYVLSSYSQLAIHYNNLGDVPHSDEYLEETRKMAEKLNENASWVSYYQAATLIYKKRQKLPEAIAFAQQAVNYSEKGGTRPENIAGAYLNLANTYLASGQLEAAIPHLYHALSGFDRANNESGQAYCYNNLAIVQRDLGLYGESLKNAGKSLELKKKINDEKGVASTYQLMAENYYRLNEPRKAFTYIDKSLAFFQAQNLTFEVVNNYHLKARTYQLLKDTANVNRFYALAIHAAKKLDAPALLSTLEKESAKFTGTTDKALALRELEVARASGDTLALMNNLNALAAGAYHTGQYKTAYDYREEYLALHEKTYGAGILKQLKKMESRYELEKKESEIRLLEKDRQLDAARLHQHKIMLYASVGLILLTVLSAWLLFNRNRALQAAKRKQELETMRNAIASDLHDDIGSTLSSIQIISNMAMMQCNGNAPLRQSVGRIAELSDRVADGIREIVWSVNPAHDQLESAMAHWRKLAADLLGTNGILFQFTSEMKNPDMELNPEQRKDLLMIFKEAINNARKYSGTDRVDILVQQDEQHLSMVIRDYGSGFDEAGVTPGNGLKNMERRAGAIGAGLRISSRVGEGTTLSLRLPLS